MHWRTESFTFPSLLALFVYFVTKRYRCSGEAQSIQSKAPGIIEGTLGQKIREGLGVLGS